MRETAFHDPHATAEPAAPVRTPRTNNPQRTMDDILAVATREFAERGLSGARIDAIAESTQTSKRMIYYYFGSKKGLYLAVLEKAYQDIRDIETESHLETLAPEEALRTLVAFTFDHHFANPEFIRLVANENLHRGEFLAQSTTIRELNATAITTLSAICERGIQAGVFRPGIDALDLHMSISSLCVFNVANRHTFSLIFKFDFDDPQTIAQRRESVVDMVMRFVRLPG
ncbi:TetR/AcrR family transcriptional regulator [Variovorax sp. HJSM1_2]|uniref:TetR/AcrR family transcriptional regulator n=1 Tax=Variovorax sp. HJSM1_2 TaxID=3366263 RepID=UPI003BC95FA0